MVQKQRTCNDCKLQRQNIFSLLNKNVNLLRTSPSIQKALRGIIDDPPSPGTGTVTYEERHTLYGIETKKYNHALIRLWATTTHGWRLGSLSLNIRSTVDHLPS